MEIKVIRRFLPLQASLLHVCQTSLDLLYIICLYLKLCSVFLVPVQSPRSDSIFHLIDRRAFTCYQRDDHTDTKAFHYA